MATPATGYRIFNRIVDWITNDRMQLINITERINEIVRKSGVRDGLVHLQSLHTTTAVFINEWQDALLHDVRQFLDEVFGHLDLDWQKYVAIDPRYFRPAEVDLLLGDASKARQVLGWKPRVTFKQLAKMMTDADRRIARRERIVQEQDHKDRAELTPITQ